MASDQKERKPVNSDLLHGEYSRRAPAALVELVIESRTLRMFPIHDSIRPETTPIVNTTMIGLCTLVFLMQSMEQPDQPGLVDRFGMIPQRLSEPGVQVDIPVSVEQVQTRRGVEQVVVYRHSAPSSVPPWLTTLTCIFLHGSLMHIVGNMWFLLIFGDNVEDRLGHVGYLIFYLLAGMAASLTHFLADLHSPVPTIGASGAIAGVMGAYMFWYPRSQVRSLVPIGWALQIMVIPAPVFLGLWFAIQFFSGIGSVITTQHGGVAWFAHIGGFVVGVATGFLIGKAPPASFR